MEGNNAVVVVGGVWLVFAMRSEPKTNQITP